LIRLNERERKKAEAEAFERRCWIFFARVSGGGCTPSTGSAVGEDAAGSVRVIIIQRHRNNGLLLSELGDHFLLGGGRGPAGGKTDAREFAAFRDWSSQAITDIYGTSDQGVSKRLAKGETRLCDLGMRV